MIKTYPYGWQVTDKVIAYPYEWQRPAKTEEWAYDYLIKANLQSHFVQWMCFPWATLIDFLGKGQLLKAEPFLQALRSSPPKTALLRGTVCQHINIREILPWLHRLKITDVFWPHTSQAESVIEGVRLHPFPLYPVQAISKKYEDAVPSDNKKWLYSYIGAYQPGLYLTNARELIAEILTRPNAYIKVRKEWHYEKAVYGEQVEGRSISADEVRILASNASEFQKVMSQSIFALCPSGSGPNSIRLWEALGLGAIPVILADSLCLPGDRKDWEEACIFVDETRKAIESIPQKLEAIAANKEKLRRHQHACQRLWMLYIENGPENLFLGLGTTESVYQWVKENE